MDACKVDNGSAEQLSCIICSNCPRVTTVNTVNTVYLLFTVYSHVATFIHQLVTATGFLLIGFNLHNNATTMVNMHCALCSIHR